MLMIYDSSKFKFLAFKLINSKEALYFYTVFANANKPFVGLRINSNPEVDPDLNPDPDIFLNSGQCSFRGLSSGFT